MADPEASNGKSWSAQECSLLHDMGMLVPVSAVLCTFLVAVAELSTSRICSCLILILDGGAKSLVARVSECVGGFRVLGRHTA